MPDENPLLRILADVERLNRRDGFGDQALALFGIERRIGCKQAARRAEIIVAAARGSDIAIQRGVGIKHLEVIARRLLQLLRPRIAVRLTEEDLFKSERDTASKIWESCRPCGG